ncbi:MAG: uroporphyrinogen-III C-methyltransferase [Geothrix sp.]
MAPSAPEAPLAPLGFVSLVGAGPGHPDLLTLRGFRALQAADVILYDALLDPSFQDLFPTEALALPVGKRCGQGGTPQEEIHRLLVVHAQQGRQVVRLKGGDPLIFGRGGEEALALSTAGIPFEIIPGVSAVQAAAAAAGIPLTHRGVSRRITLLEGHHLPEAEAEWQALVQGGGTLAIYMGTRSIQALARSLLRQGAPPALPIALVERAQCPDQATTLSTLTLAATGALRATTAGPGILLIGEALHHRTQPEISHGPASALPGPHGEAGPAGGRRQRRAG